MPSLSLSPSLWETVKCDFKELFPEDVFQMWFEPMSCLETTEDAMTLGVPNDFAAIWIHDNYLDLITQRLRLTAGRLVNVTLRKAETNRAPATSHSHKIAAESATRAAVQRVVALTAGHRRRLRPAGTTTPPDSVRLRWQRDHPRHGDAAHAGQRRL